MPKQNYTLVKINDSQYHKNYDNHQNIKATLILSSSGIKSYKKKENHVSVAGSKPVKPPKQSGIQVSYRICKSKGK